MVLLPNKMSSDWNIIFIVIMTIVFILALNPIHQLLKINKYIYKIHHSNRKEKKRK
jgi:hypothetical protein